MKNTLKMFSIKCIGVAILLCFCFTVPKSHCKVDSTDRYFAVETADGEEVTLSFPLLAEKLTFGIELVSASYCPKIAFTSRAQNSSVTPSLIVTFCSSLCILKSSGIELMRKSYAGILADKYKGFWVSFDQLKGIIRVGERNEDISMIEYTYASRAEFAGEFLTHFSLGGVSRWIIEKTTENLVAESVNVDHATTFFPLLTNKIQFGIKSTTKVATKCPRVEFHDRPSKTNTHYLAFSFCKTSFNLADGSSILQEVPGVLLNNKWTSGYWIHLNQKSNKLSVGRNLNSTPFYQYFYGTRFKDLFFTHYSFVGMVKLTLLTNGQD